jgi:hypothetical protein
MINTKILKFKMPKMNSMKRLLILFTCILLSFLDIQAQKPTQNIRGVVMDAETKKTLPGANIILVGKNKGTSTDAEGKFILEDVEVGRHELKVSFIGYEKKIIPEILLSSGSEKVLEIKMEPTAQEMEEVIVKPKIRKDRPMNSMATVSARTFSVEEAGRYAGAIDDPGRMAGNFAGVTTVAPNVNAIVVRGNAPKGLSWRLEGVDIPVPSHFSGSNVVGGGGLTVFSSQMLANSDFYTGAFPAEYGNATAGVFDMKLRNGNNREHEYAFQLGVQGIEAAAEGPFSENGTGSYLVNYRYSTMALIFPLLPETNYTDEFPIYQDLSFKLNFPAGKAGKFSLWGIGGLSKSTMRGSDDPDDWIYPANRDKMNFHYNMGAMGFSHSRSLSDNTYLRSTLSLNGSEHMYDEKSRLDSLQPSTLFPLHKTQMIENKVTLTSELTHVFNPHLTIKGGVDASNLMYHLQGNARNYTAGTFPEIMDANGNSWLLESYVQGKYKLTQKLFFTAGVNASWFEINDGYTIEPRISGSWQFHENHQLSLGYGNHSQTEPLFVYFVTEENSTTGAMQYPNKNLGRMRAHHFVLGYDWSITKNLRMKIEPYYQFLYDVPVVDGTAYSMINFMSDWTFDKELENTGTGTNRGIDLTLERFLKNGLYFMTTASIYESEYTGGDDVTRRTRYDGGYVVNLLGGKEWVINDKNMLSLNLKFTFMGPYWHHPVNKSATHLQEMIVYAENKPFSYRNSDIESMTDLTVNYHINGTNTSSIFSVQVKNIVGKQYMGKMYNLEEQQIEKDFFTSPVPFIHYKIEF